MKIRAGFVSNSSSSSFVVICSAKLNRNKLNKLFGVSKRHPLYAITQQIVECVMEKAELATESPDWEYHQTPELQAALDKGKFVYVGTFSDVGNGGEEVESLLCNSNLNIKKRNITIKHSGGY